MENFLQGLSLMTNYINTPNKVLKLWKNVGPGLITGAADDDPSGIATYSQTGAQFGYQFLWLSLFTLPFIIIVQEMCARIGIVTGEGLAKNIKHQYPAYILHFVSLLLFIANTFNISADLNAMAACVQLFMPHLNALIITAIFGCCIVFLQITLTYSAYSKHLKYITFIFFSYIITAFLIKVDWIAAYKNLFIPPLVFKKEHILIICAILGTTISPYLFFWQTSQECEEKIKNKKTKKGTSKKMFFNMRFDISLGMFFSNIIMFFIIIVCASTLYTHGITDVKTAADAAQALKPLAGKWAEFMFASGIIGAGLLSIPVLAGSSAYAVAETFNWKEGLYKKWYQAFGFYSIITFSVIIAFVINLFGIPAMKGLIYSAILNGIVAPVLLYFILRIGSNKKLMGIHTNNLLSSIGCWCLTILMSISGLLAIIFLIFNI